MLPTTFVTGIGLIHFNSWTWLWLAGILGICISIGLIVGLFACAPTSSRDRHLRWIGIAAGIITILMIAMIGAGILRRFKVS